MNSNSLPSLSRREMLKSASVGFGSLALAGLSKLILRPLASNDKDTIHQTQLMINEVQPAVAAMNTELQAAE